MVIIRVPFVYDSDLVSDDTAIHEFSESMTDQSQKEDADINTLVRRFHITGEMPQFDRLPIQADFHATMSYQDAMNAVIEADSVFMELPADLRARFHHDPHEFLSFCSNDKNKDEIKKLGLLKPDPAPTVPFEVIVKGGSLDPAKQDVSK